MGFLGSSREWPPRKPGVPRNPPPPPKVKDAPPVNVEEEYDRWVQKGVDRGWITKPDCIHHGATDPLPWTEEEAAEVDDGLDPCLVAARFWGPFSGRSS